jgi:putative transposase
VQVAEPNRRWASDITGIRAWNGQKGRLAIMIDCADRMVLTWRFATRITAEDLAEMLREAVFTVR